MERDPYIQLKDAILTAELRPNQKLKVLELKQRLMAGQAPLREALNRLVGEGLVQDLGSRGVCVAPVSESAFRDLASVLTLIEQQALADALVRGDAHWEASILASAHILHTVESSERISYPQWSQANRAFHNACVAACGSPILLQLRRQLLDQWDRYAALTFRLREGQLERNWKEHAMLVEAILQRNLPQVEQLVAQHIQGVVPWVLGRLAQTDLPEQRALSPIRTDSHPD